MTTGTVEKGRGAVIGRGATVGIGLALGSAAAVGTASAPGPGRALVTGTTRGGMVTLGIGSGDATAGRRGTSVGRRVAPASDVRGDAVHATDAISAKNTSSRRLFLPTAKRSKSPANRPQHAT